jgi:transcriptional regulator GlxA family with amidase domain
VQLRRVKERLTSTDFPLGKIAGLAGFNYVESMCCLFKRATGQTPGEYRDSVNG